MFVFDQLQLAQAAASTYMRACPRVGSAERAGQAITSRPELSLAQIEAQG